MKGTKSCLAHLERIADAINEGVPKQVTQFADQRAELAQASYNAAIYTGKKDVVVTSTTKGDEWHITASGESLLFIEFGTGITYTRNNPIDHPYNFPGSWSVEHGQYLTDSEKLAKYKGGWPLRHRVTYGNPSANVMYETGKRVREDLPDALLVELNKAVKS